MDAMRSQQHPEEKNGFEEQHPQLRNTSLFSVHVTAKTFCPGRFMEVPTTSGKPMLKAVVRKRRTSVFMTT